MSRPHARGIYVTAFIAVLLHAILFVAVRPKAVSAERGYDSVPATSYLFPEESGAMLSESEVRTINSPVLFSLPSSIGFSRALQARDVETRLNTFSRPEHTVSFLEVDPSLRHKDARLQSENYLLSAGTLFAPTIPDVSSEEENKKISSRRITLAPVLLDRMEGGVVFPAELNQPTEVPWEVRASVSISEHGVVKHVFLEQPLESPEMNAQVLRLLRSLRFKPGLVVEGSVEIYSPEASVLREEP